MPHRTNLLMPGFISNVKFIAIVAPAECPARTHSSILVTTLLMESISYMAAMAILLFASVSAITRVGFNDIYYNYHDAPIAQLASNGSIRRMVYQSTGEKYYSNFRLLRFRN